MPKFRKFRKRPVVVEASQWLPGVEGGDHPQVGYYRNPDDDPKRHCKHCGCTMHDHGWIDTLEGGHIVCPADWIFEGVRGEFYPCKPDIKEETYEEVEGH